jgi:thiamine-phosphate pyrophosphorylase
MKLIVISSSEELDGEIKMIHELFEAGLQNFHLRKPKLSTNALRRYLDRINPKYYNRIVIHSHHELSVSYKLRGIHLTEHHRGKNYWQSWLRLKYIKLRRSDIQVTAGLHTIGSLSRENPGYAYVFLSPVFNSISKLGTDCFDCKACA